MTLDDVMLAARAARPYYAAALAALRPRWSEQVPTMGVGRNWSLLVNEAWASAHSVRQLGFVVADHELQHLLRRHAARAENAGLEHRVANIAGDAEINDDSEEMQTLAEIEGGILPKTLGCEDGLLMEEYARHVQAQAADPRCGSGSGGERLDDEGGAADGPSELEADAIRRVTAEAVEAAAGRGDVPEGAVVWADQELARINRRDWRRDIIVAVGHARRLLVPGRYDYSRARPSRRSVPGGILYPRPVSYAPETHVIVDTSGSVSGPLAALALAVCGQIRTCCPGAVWWACDAAASRIRYGHWVGGGGTDMCIGITAAQAAGAEMIIVVTDGDTPWPRQDGKLLAVIVGDGQIPDGIKTVKIQEQK